MNPDTGNLFHSLPDATGKEVFTHLAGNASVRIERIVSKGQATPESDWYDQENHEWVVLLQGEAKLAFDHGDTLHLLPGSYVHIPAHARHKVLWTAPDTETIWLAIHYQ